MVPISQNHKTKMRKWLLCVLGTSVSLYDYVQWVLRLSRGVNRGNHGVSELPLEPYSSGKFRGSKSFVWRQHLTQSFSCPDGAAGQVKTLCDNFSSVERGQAGKQQIIKLMSTFIAVKAVKASHGFLIKSHKAYLQSHIIFLVIQTRSLLWNSYVFSWELHECLGVGVHQILVFLMGMKRTLFLSVCVVYGFRANVFWPLPKRSKAAIFAFHGQKAGIPCSGHRTSNCGSVTWLQLSIMVSHVSRPLINFLEMCLRGVWIRVITWENKSITCIKIEKFMCMFIQQFHPADEHTHVPKGPLILK